MSERRRAFLCFTCVEIPDMTFLVKGSLFLSLSFPRLLPGEEARPRTNLLCVPSGFLSPAGIFRPNLFAREPHSLRGRESKERESRVSRFRRAHFASIRYKDSPLLLVGRAAGCGFLEFGSNGSTIPRATHNIPGRFRRVKSRWRAFKS